MIIPIKQFTPLLSVFLLNATYRRPFPARSIQLLITVICICSGLAVLAEVPTDFLSYLLGMLSMVALAASGILFENVGQRYSPVEMLYIHSFNCLIFLLFADLYEDEIRDSIIYFFTGSSAAFIVNAAFVFMLGVLLQFIIFSSFVYVGAVTTTLTACIAAVIEVMLSFVFSIYIYFDRMPSLMNFVGAVLTAVAGVILVNVNPQLTIMTVALKKSQQVFPP